MAKNVNYNYSVSIVTNTTNSIHSKLNSKLNSTDKNAKPEPEEDDGVTFILIKTKIIFK